MEYSIILFDSGRVLNGPATGHWMIPPKFFEVVNKTKFKRISKKRRRNAFSLAMKYINGIEFMNDIDEEYIHFCKYYNIVSNQLPELNLSKLETKKIAYDLVYNLDKYTFYKDAIEYIPKFNKHYTLSVVSDAWPSLNKVFEYNNFMKYFDSFINSSNIGVRKPNKQMYLTALEETNHCVKEAVFIDDRVRNCDGAKAVGIDKTYLLCRGIVEYYYYKSIVKNHIVVKDLEKVYKDLRISE